MEKLESNPFAHCLNALDQLESSPGLDPAARIHLFKTLRQELGDLPRTRETSRLLHFVDSLEQATPHSKAFMDNLDLLKNEIHIFDRKNSATGASPIARDPSFEDFKPGQPGTSDHDADRYDDDAFHGRAAGGYRGADENLDDPQLDNSATNTTSLSTEEERAARGSRGLRVPRKI